MYFSTGCVKMWKRPKLLRMILKAAILPPVILLKMGCKKIAYLSTSSTLSINNKRMEGFKKALADNGIKNNTADIISCYSNTDGNYKIIKEVLKKKNRPDGIIASVEKLTTPIYLACKDLELSIPDKIKVISFTNLQAALILSPTLTTVTQPAFEMGKVGRYYFI